MQDSKVFLKLHNCLAQLSLEQHFRKHQQNSFALLVLHHGNCNLRFTLFEPVYDFGPIRNVEEPFLGCEQASKPGTLFLSSFSSISFVVQLTSNRNRVPKDKL